MVVSDEYLLLVFVFYELVCLELCSWLVCFVGFFIILFSLFLWMFFFEDLVFFVKKWGREFFFLFLLGEEVIL